MHKVGQKKGDVPSGAAVPLTQRLSLSPEETSLLTGIGLTSIREAAAKGTLTARKLGTRTIILREDVEAWIRTLPLTGKKAVIEEPA